MKETTAYSRRPHQELAIADVIAGFQTDDRGQLVMACGTGKTLTGLWIKEDLCAELTLVLVPSIALLDQFASEWRKHFSSKQPYAALCVCSDETVGRNASRDRDTIQFTAEDLAHDGFDVTSAPECIAAFLVQRGRKVVFSTYQSSHLIAEAQADEAVPAFDLAIADEAHRCAGDPTSVFATILKEGKIRARKRLFTTATPRIYGRRKGQKEFGESVVDMSDEALFGPRFHTLTFGEAIRLDLLSDYRVVIMLIDDAEIQAVLKVGQSGADLSDDEKHKWLRAAQVGFLKTVRQFDLRRVISFHSYVKNARVFADDLPAVADVMWADESGTGVPKADFISGEMSAEVRKRKLAEFRATEEGEYRVLTNARCLTEGIDVPDIDGVAFVDPRSGHVDIIQALGRAIRKHERKKYGTVILPVFLGRGDSADEVIENSHFKPVWDVLNALRAHDADFETALNTRRQAGGGAEPGMADPFEKIEILGAEHVVGLAATLEPLLLNELTDGWEEGVGTARAYFEQYGHCNAADGSRWPEGDPKGYPLGTWLVNQRQARKAGKLSAERAQRLDALGMVWSLRGAQWEEGFGAARACFEQYGHCNAPVGSRWPEGDPKGYPLGQWLVSQRQARKAGKLSAERAQRLDALGMVWSQRGAQWEEGFGAARACFEQYGHCNAPVGSRWPEGDPKGYPLGQWLASQRQARKAGKLSAERAQRLDALGMVWNPLEAQWEEGFGAARACFEQYGHCNAAAKSTWPEGDPKGYPLGTWVGVQRRAQKAGKLPAERAQRLEALGMVWDMRAPQQATANPPEYFVLKGEAHSISRKAI